MKRNLILLLALSAILLPPRIQAATPSLINYQGHVTNASDVAIGAGGAVNRTVRFRFWNSPTLSGNPANLLYSEEQTVTFNEGDFSVLIGGSASIAGEPHPDIANVFDSSQVFVGITVDVGGNGIGDDSEITPRQQLVTTAFAFRSKVAEGVDAGAITETMLGDASVTSNKIGAGAVTANAVALGAVKGGNDADLTPANRGMILDGSISTFDLADLSVTTAKLATDSVTTAKIQNGQVTTDKIADLNVTLAKLAPNSVDTDKIANGNVTYADLQNLVQYALCPTGTIMAYVGDTAPTGWLLCDGTLYNTGSYPALHGVIGSKFGFQSGQFRVPDFRGKFLRGKDGGAGYDPNRTTRTNLYTGGAIGDNVGSYQADAFESHTHTWGYGTEGDDEGSGGSADEFTQTPGSVTTAIGATGGSETRPHNINVNYIIKW